MGGASYSAVLLIPGVRNCVQSGRTSKGRGALTPGTVAFS